MRRSSIFPAAERDRRLQGAPRAAPRLRLLGRIGLGQRVAVRRLVLNLRQVGFLVLDPGNGSVEVGGILLGTALRRTPAATEAMHLMAAHVFEDLGYRRYEWKCDALNAASVAAALRLGFRPEGTFRNAVVYKGRNRDTAWFSITDSEWGSLAGAHRGWLDPANFDADGRQRTPLAGFLASARKSIS